MLTPFDDLRCVDCNHLWSEHSRIPGDPALHFVMDNSTAEEVRQHLVDLTAERDALKVETERLRAELTEVRAELEDAEIDRDNFRRRLDDLDIDL